MHNVQLVIANLDRPASGEASFDRLDPLSGKVATRAAAASPDDARAAADAAEAAFPAWSQTGPGLRRTLLLKAADLLQGRADDFVAAMAVEIGATEGWARFNVMLAAGMLR
jgi:acyl-CoA reductase-like NAD-dependent aldehyde dehydrogenase